MVIRMAEPADAATIQAVYAPIVQATPISFELDVPDAAEIERRIVDTLRFWPWLVAADGRDVLGYAYASRYRARAAYQWSVEVTVYIGENHRRRGIGQRLYRALFAILRLQRFYSAYAGITLPNPASVRLHERVGFQPVGVYRSVGYKLGCWHDVAWYGLTLQALPERPAPPATLAEVSGRPELARELAAAARGAGDGATGASDGRRAPGDAGGR